MVISVLRVASVKTIKRFHRATVPLHCHHCIWSSRGIQLLQACQRGSAYQYVQPAAVPSLPRPRVACLGDGLAHDGGPAEEGKVHSHESGGHGARVNLKSATGDCPNGSEFQTLKFLPRILLATACKPFVF